MNISLMGPAPTKEHIDAEISSVIDGKSGLFKSKLKTDVYAIFSVIGMWAMFTTLNAHFGFMSWFSFFIMAALSGFLILNIGYSLIGMMFVPMFDNGTDYSVGLMQDFAAVALVLASISCVLTLRNLRIARIERKLANRDHLLEMLQPVSAHDYLIIKELMADELISEYRHLVIDQERDFIYQELGLMQNHWQKTKHQNDKEEQERKIAEARNEVFSKDAQFA
jgi:hypothetical protein